MMFVRGLEYFHKDSDMVSLAVVALMTRDYPPLPYPYVGILALSKGLATRFRACLLRGRRLPLLDAQHGFSKLPPWWR